MITQYQQAVDYIHSTLKLGSKLGLDNITYLLNLMGNPQRKLKIIHVAGTNGKGSTVAMLARILNEAGYRTGMYTSPYIEQFTERIQIDGENIPGYKLVEMVNFVRRHIQTMLESNKNHPTEFEIITAIAFEYFYREQCDFVVLETGLGGRLDATNVIDLPVAVVITSISRDHMNFLGYTEDKIAAEKCGIIKENVTVVTSPYQQSAALEVIKKTAAQKKCRLIIADADEIKLVDDGMKCVIDYKHLKGIGLALAGQHQIANAATAIETAFSLNIPDNAIVRGIQNTVWMGRLEFLTIKPGMVRNSHPLPDFLIDGAHNLSGIISLKNFLQKFFSAGKTVIVMGMLADKEYTQCLEVLSGTCSLFVATSVNHPNSLPAAELANTAKKYFDNVVVLECRRQAINYAIEQTEGLVCCCGSLYLVGEVRSIITKPVPDIYTTSLKDFPICMESIVSCDQPNNCTRF